MTIKDISTILGTWVAILSAAAGGYFAYTEFKAQGDEARAQNQRRMDERTLQTFRMYEDFRNSDMLARRAKFDTMRSDDPALDFWINYFDTVQACVESSLCDQTLVDQLFKPYAIASLDEVQCRIVDVREIEKDYKLPRQQGYGLLMISGVAEPACEREGLTPAAVQPAKTAAKTVTPAASEIATLPLRGVSSGQGDAAPATTQVEAAPTPATGRGGRGSAGQTDNAPAAGPEPPPVRGRGN
jgi:hypothetical protein